MVVMYPLTIQLDYTELKYSLRSLEKYLKKISEVIIVGEYVPEWLTGITHIDIPDIKGKRELSVRRKILAALQYAGEVFYMNDDIFLLDNYDTSIYYSSGLLAKSGEAGVKPLLKHLQDFNKPVKYYGHYPAIYKNDFREVMERFSAECLNKSAYLNFMEVQSINVPDCKLMKATKAGVIKEFIKNKPCFSTGTNSINSALPVLEELFSEPSFYEI